MVAVCCGCWVWWLLCVVVVVCGGVLCVVVVVCGAVCGGVLS